MREKEIAKENFEKGREEGKKNIIKNMIKQGFDLSSISKCADISMDELDELVKKIENNEE